MPLDHRPLNTTLQGTSRIDWKSAMLGAGVAFAVSWALVVRPGRADLVALETQIARLSRTAARLDAARDGVSGASRLLAALEEQAVRAPAAEAALRRAEASLEIIDRVHGELVRGGVSLDAAHRAAARLADLGDTLSSEAADIDTARLGLDRLAGLKDSLVVSSAGIDRAEGSFERLVGLKDGLVAELSELDAAEQSEERLAELKDRLVDDATGLGDAEAISTRLALIKDGLLAETKGLDDAEATLARLEDLADWVRASSTMVGDLRDLVGDVVMLEPAVERAVRALGPVVEFTTLGRRMGGRSQAPSSDTTTADGEAKVIGVARTPADARP